MAADQRKTLNVLIVILAAALVGAIVAVWSVVSGMMRPPTSDSPSRLANAKISAVEVVIEVSAANESGSVSGVLLAPGGSATNYMKTKTAVHVNTNSATRFVMGSKTDLTRGAIVAVQGTRVSIAPLVIDSGRIVVLTGSVTVK